jgi:hypothetical protein
VHPASQRANADALHRGTCLCVDGVTGEAASVMMKRMSKYTKKDTGVKRYAPKT